MTYAVRPLHITRTALLSLLLAIALAPRSFAQTPPAPQYYRVQTIKLNSGMRPDWEKFYQAEILPALKKVGVKQHSVWRVAQGDLRQYFIITPINSLAELDEPSPLLKALGQEAGQALMTKQSRFFGEWRQDIVVGRPDLGIALTPNSPLKLAVLDTETVAPGHTADYEKWVKENILPVVKKTNAKGVLTGKTALGSDPNEYHVLVLFDSYAEIEKFVTTSAKAAAELKERVHQRCKEQLGEVAGLAEMYIGTIHGFCLELLKSEVPAYMKFEVLNEVQQALATFYRDLQKHQPEDNVVVVDGSRSIDEVQELVYAAVKAAAGA